MGIRQKGTGHLFVRGNIWYMRYRYNHIETTKTTGVLVDTTDDVTYEQSRAQANAVLMKETEILRLQDKKSRLQVIKVMLETTSEQIRDRMEGLAKETPLARLAALFRTSSRRIDCSQAQLEAYSRYISILVRTLGADMAVSAIDDRMAERVAYEIGFGRSPNTYNKYLNGLAVVWDAMGTRFGCASNPWRTLPRKHLDTVVRNTLTEDQTDRVIDAADGEMKVLIAIGLYTGLRLGDAVHLKWKKISNDLVMVKTSKTGAEVAIPVHRKLADTLPGRGAPDEFIMPSLAMAYDAEKANVSRAITRLFQRCGIKTTTDKIGNCRARPLCGFHSLRHCFVSRCISAGIPQTVVKALVGHASVKMTDHYTHLKDEAFLTAFKNMV